MAAPETSPLSEDRATWPPSKLEAKPLQSPLGMGSPGMPVSAGVPGGVAGREDRSAGASGHSWRLGNIEVSQRVPRSCGVSFHPGETCFCLGDGAAQGISGKRAAGYKLRGQPPLQLALKTIT